MTSRLLAGTILALSLFTLPALAQGYYGEPQSPQSLGGGNGDDLITPPPQAQPYRGPSPTDVQVRFQSMDAQLRNMQGIVEKLQFRNQQLEQQLSRMNSDHDTRFQIIEKRLADQEVALKNAPTSNAAAEALAENVAAEAAANATGTKSESTDAPAPAPKTDKTLGTISSSGKPAGDAQALYDSAFQSLRQTKYDDAERDFKSFLKNNPKHRLTENAKYWLAETYYVRGNFSDAAVVFAETYQEFPQGSKAPDNLLKLAMSLAGLKKTQDACLTLAELKKRFPTTSAGIRNRAEQEKKTLGCP